MLKSLRSFIESPIVEINFAGFRSTAQELQHNGWDLSAYETMSDRGYGKNISLMLRHDSGVTFMTRMETVRPGFIEDVIHSPVNLKFSVNGITFENSTRFITKPDPVVFDFKPGDFSAVDVMPMVKTVDLDDFDLSKFGVFRKLNDSANIFLPEQTASELMREIIKKQSPKQAEIREKRRRREAYGELFERKPNDEIKLQLIAI